MVQLVRTPAQLQEARNRLGLSTEALARVLRVEDGRTVRRWEAGDRAIPGPVTVIMETIMGNLADQELIAQQLAALRAGKFKIGQRARAGSIDKSAANVTQLEKQKADLESALAILMRQPEAEGRPSDRVHWYQLSRRTPKHQPPERDEWTMPGELSPEAALFYFVKSEHVAPGLELCSDDDPAEYVLYQRELHRTQHGAAMRLSAGKVLRSFSVREVSLPALR